MKFRLTALAAGGSFCLIFFAGLGGMRIERSRSELGSPSAAARAWREAYAAAIQSGRWDGMVQVGDAALRVGDEPYPGESPRARARKSYLLALSRARAEGSLDGVLRVAEAFRALDDRAAAAQCVLIAEGLAGHDAQARERIWAAGRPGDPLETASR